ncbi:MAG TPA: (2Fe-2S)-binding protein [Pirellulales bacterium]|jgi:NAD(P)H-nitrite reductase large subunit|nr:(2Fe-2S)-binding protein [Pirellulales bacterium]
MELDDELCLCFHVTKRKVINYLRVEKPRRVGQLSECFGAGAGCGWCRPYLQRLFDAAVAGGKLDPQLPAAADYARGRTGYVRSGGGTPPPGATPIDESPDPGR